LYVCVCKCSRYALQGATMEAFRSPPFFCIQIEPFRSIKMTNKTTNTNKSLRNVFLLFTQKWDTESHFYRISKCVCIVVVHILMHICLVFKV